MTDFRSVEGKIAVITGATSGIGREIAKTFAANGMKVVIDGRNAERGAKIVTDIVNKGGEATFVQGDVRNEEDVKKLVSVAVEK